MRTRAHACVSVSVCVSVGVSVGVCVRAQQVIIKMVSRGGKMTECAHATAPVAAKGRTSAGPPGTKASTKGRGGKGGGKGVEVEDGKGGSGDGVGGGGGERAGHVGELTLALDTLMDSGMGSFSAQVCVHSAMHAFNDVYHTILRHTYTHSLSILRNGQDIERYLTLHAIGVDSAVSMESLNISLSVSTANSVCVCVCVCVACVCPLPLCQHCQLIVYVYVCVCVCVDLSVGLSVCLSVCLSLFLSLSLSLSLSVCVSPLPQP